MIAHEPDSPLHDLILRNPVLPLLARDALGFRAKRFAAVTPEFENRQL